MKNILQTMINTISKITKKTSVEDTKMTDVKHEIIKVSKPSAEKTISIDMIYYNFETKLSVHLIQKDIEYDRHLSKKFYINKLTLVRDKEPIELWFLANQTKKLQKIVAFINKTNSDTAVERKFNKFVKKYNKLYVATKNNIFFCG